MTSFFIVSKVEQEPFYIKLCLSLLQPSGTATKMLLREQFKILKKNITIAAYPRNSFLLIKVVFQHCQIFVYFVLKIWTNVIYNSKL